MTDKAAHLTNLFSDLTLALIEANYQHERYIEFHDTVECATHPDASEYDYAKSKADDACNDILNFLHGQDQNIQGILSLQRTIEALQMEVYNLPDMEEQTFELPDPSDFEPPAPPDDPELVFGFDFKQAIKWAFYSAIGVHPSDGDPEPPTLRLHRSPPNLLGANLEFTDSNKHKDSAANLTLHSFSLDITLTCANTTQTTTTTAQTTSPTCASSETHSNVENAGLSTTLDPEQSSALSDTSSTGKAT